MRVVVPSKEKEVLEQVTWNLDKLENDTLPQVDLSTLEVSLYRHVCTVVDHVHFLFSSTFPMYASWTATPNDWW